MAAGVEGGADGRAQLARTPADQGDRSAARVLGHVATLTEAMTDAPAPPRRVVVTGMGVLSGPCVGIDDFWAALTTPTPGPTHRKIEGFVPRDWLDRRAVQRTDRFAQVAVAAARLASTDAGEPTDDPDRVAVVMGTGNGGIHSFVRAYDAFAERGRAGVDLLTGVMSMSNAGAANIAFADQDNTAPNWVDITAGYQFMV